jgi:hypothetical protein
MSLGKSGSAFALGLSCLAAAAQAAPGDTIDAAALDSGTPQLLAERVMGAALAADVEGMRVERDPLLGTPAIRFFHRPAPAAADFCGRATHYVPLAAIAAPGAAPDNRAGPFRIGQPVEGRQIAYSRLCETGGEPAFATLNPGVAPDAAMEAIRDLAGAIAAARRPRRLRFALVCRDDLNQGGCQGDGRQVLGGLNIAQAWLIEEGRIVVGVPGRIFWEMQPAGFRTGRGTLTMVRKVPAPF